MATKVEKQQERVIPDTLSFMTGARWRSGSIVIEQSRSVMDLSTGQARTIPGLRVKVQEHKIDINAAAIEGNWDLLDEQEGKEPGWRRKKAEKALLSHRDFGRSDGSGIFIDSTSTMGELELQARGVQKKCMFMQDVGGGQTQQCTETVSSPDDDFCTAHMEFVKAAQAKLHHERTVAAQSKSDGE